MFIQDDTIKSFVINAGLLGHADAHDVHARAQKKGLAFGEQLIRDGKLSEDDVRRLYAQALGMPFVDLRQITLSFDTLTLIPEPIARAKNIAVYAIKDMTAEVAILDNEAFDTIQEISQKTGITFYPRLTTADSMRYALSQYQKKLKNNFGDTIHSHVTEIVKGNDSEDISVKKIVSTLLEHAITSHASDIHIEPRETVLAVRYRLLGSLHDAMILPLDIAAKMSHALREMSAGQPAFYIKHGGKDVLVKVSYLPLFAGEKITLKIVHKGIGKASLESLGYDGYALDAMHTAIHRKKGLIIFAGQPRAGLTTSMYSVLGTTNTANTSIATVEEKIEQQLPFASQSILNNKEGFTRVAALRRVLQQDPDVVMIDAIENTEVLDLAVHAGERGVCVVSSVRAKGTIGALEQLLSMSQHPDYLTKQLSFISYQRLVKRLAKEKEKYFLSEAGMKALSKVVNMDKVLVYMKDNHIVSAKATWKNIPLYRAIKSDESPSGYAGSIGIFEVLVLNDGVRNAIAKGSINDVIKESTKQGMLSVYEDGLVKAVQGLTTVDEVLRASI